MKHIPNQILIKMGKRKSVSDYELTENFVSFTRLFVFMTLAKHIIKNSELGLKI